MSALVSSPASTILVNETFVEIKSGSIHPSKVSRSLSWISSDFWWKKTATGLAFVEERGGVEVVELRRNRRTPNPFQFGIDADFLAFLRRNGEVSSSSRKHFFPLFWPRMGRNGAITAQLLMCVNMVVEEHLSSGQMNLSVSQLLAQLILIYKMLRMFCPLPLQNR